MKLHILLSLALVAVALAGCASPTPPSTTTSPSTNPASPTPPTSPTPTTPPGTTPATTPSTSPSPVSNTVTTPPAAPQSNVALNGAGASFPYPLLSKWSSAYNKQTGVQVNYQSIGSGGGIKAITDKTVDFAGSDAPLNPAQRTAAPGLVHIPETLGAVTLAYNVPELGTTQLKLTGPLIASIYLGQVQNWNDAAIAALNPGVNLPAKAIFTVHRSDGSGTTFVFTDYLSKVSDTWKSSVGKGTSVSWPQAAQNVGGSGNAGVAGVVQGQPYTLGYVELAYAAQNHLAFAQVQNKANNWISPSLQGVNAAAADYAATLPVGDGDWGNVSIVNANATDAYPISSFTYLLVYKDLSGAYGSKMDTTRATALLQFIWWAVHDGQQYSEGLQYAKLPASVVALDEATLKSVTFNGQPLVTGA